MRELVDRAKTASMEEVMKHFGVDVPPSGKIRCVFHDDSDPSMQVYRDSNSAFCFGCKKAADPIDIVRKYTKMSFLDAIQFLIDTFKTASESDLKSKVVVNDIPSIFYMLDTVPDIGKMSEAYDQTMFLHRSGCVSEEEANECLMNAYYSIRYGLLEV